MMATSNLPVIETSYLSQAPARVSAAPIMIYKEKLMMKAFTYCSSEAILVKDPNDDKIPRYKCYQKYQGLKLHDDLRAIVNLPNCLWNRAEAYHEEATHNHAGCEEGLHEPTEGVEGVLLPDLTLRVIRG